MNNNVNFKFLLKFIINYKEGSNTKVRGDMAEEAMFGGGTLLAIGRCARTGSI